MSVCLSTVQYVKLNLVWGDRADPHCSLYTKHTTFYLKKKANMKMFFFSHAHNSSNPACSKCILEMIFLLVFFINSVERRLLSLSLFLSLACISTL